MTRHALASIGIGRIRLLCIKDLRWRFSRLGDCKCHIFALYLLSLSKRVLEDVIVSGTKILLLSFKIPPEHILSLRVRCLLRDQVTPTRLYV